MAFGTTAVNSLLCFLSGCAVRSGCGATIISTICCDRFITCPLVRQQHLPSPSRSRSLSNARMCRCVRCRIGSFWSMKSTWVFTSHARAYSYCSRRAAADPMACVSTETNRSRAVSFDFVGCISAVAGLLAVAQPRYVATLCPINCCRLPSRSVAINRCSYAASTAAAGSAEDRSKRRTWLRRTPPVNILHHYPGTASASASAPSSLSSLSGRAFAVIDRAGLYRFLLRMKDPATGAFRVCDDGEIDTRYGMAWPGVAWHCAVDQVLPCALRVCVVLCLLLQGDVHSGGCSVIARSHCAHFIAVAHTRHRQTHAVALSFVAHWMERCALRRYGGMVGVVSDV